MTQNAQTQTSNDNLLPEDAHMAMQKLIKIASNLKDLAENETQRLVQNDMLGFSMLQGEKESLVNSYVQASGEFKKRLEEFRGMDPAILDRLDGIQKTLGERTKSNNVIVRRMHEKSQENTMNSLLAAQEIAQTLPIHFAEDHQQNEMAQESQGKS